MGVHEHPNHQVVHDGFAAIRAGNFEQLRNLMADDIVVHNTGANPLAGDYSGFDEVTSLLKRMLDSTGNTLTVEPFEVFADDELILIKTRVQAQRGSRTIDLTQIDLVHMEAGKVTEAWVFPEDAEASDAFWSET